MKKANRRSEGEAPSRHLAIRCGRSTRGREEVLLAVFSILILACSSRALAEGARESEKRWYLGIKASNYRPALKEFERRIDAEIREPLKAILPSWQGVESFKDWSDDSEVWDIWLEGGRDLSPKASWFISAGGTGATIRTNQTYFPVGIPFTTDVRFRGTELGIMGGLAYFPLGKPALDCRSRTWNVVKQAVLRAKPYGEIGVGYTFFRGEGTVTLGLPMLNRLYKNKEEFRFHLLEISPRIGVEFPLNRRDSISLVGSYRFFHGHGAEFDSPAVSAVIKHRF